ncbi:HlyD family type I secretion periplasmic adaptor subunit [Brevundimonas sp. SL161]|uniref:HlyD family type I secretion periplasmic adaptor subunit n=1 Tax=Brevundimonas sp. SL161 TaxID=2804613 RepID=UPI003CEB8BBC
MKFDFEKLARLVPGQSRPAIEPPVFGSQPVGPSAVSGARISGPMRTGIAIVVVGVLGLGLWASLAPLWSAVIAPGVIRVEANRQELRSREGGVVRAIYVRNGDSVRSGQLLMQFDDTVARAQMAVLTNQHDNVLMQMARFQAEVRGQSSLIPPAELAARRNDPAVATIISNETLVFSSRLLAIQGQAAILNQRVGQLQSARSGLNVQVQSIDDQVDLIQQELDGYQRLYEQGFAPRTLILRYQRQLAEIGGRRGALAADIQRNQQQAGETRLQLAQLFEQRNSEAATGLREAEVRLADIAPRLDAARLSLAETRVISPANGYVINQTQFTIGGVARAGETVLDVVPSNAPLLISARVRPTDIDEVRTGLTAQVTLNAFSTNKVPKLHAEVVTVSADALTDEQSGLSYFVADLRIPPAELRRLPAGVRITPGMQVTAMIRTGRRTIMSYLLGPIGDIGDNAMREQ